MGRYPAKTVAANIKDHYTSFAPMLKRAGCTWNHDHKDYGKEIYRKKAYEQIEKKLKWEAGRGKANYKNIRMYFRKAWVKQTSGQNLDEFEQRYLNLFSFLSTSMGDHVEQLKLLTMKAIKSITSQNASNVIDEFHLSMDKRETSGTVSQLGPSTSQSDIELSISDADSGFLEQSDDISQNEQQAVPGTDLPTSVPVLHLNRVDDGVTSSTTDGNNLNVPDLSTSVSIVALNGVDDGVSSSTSHGNGLNSSDLSTSVSIIQLNSVDDSVMTYGSDSNSVPTEHDGKSQEGPIDANANGIMCINESKDAILQVLYL